MLVTMTCDIQVEEDIWIVKLDIRFKEIKTDFFNFYFFNMDISFDI